MASAARANKRRTTRAKAKPKPKAEQERNGVAVFITPPDDQGQSQMTVQTLGDTRPTEAPILLEKAVQVARAQHGLPPLSGGN